MKTTVRVLLAAILAGAFAMVAAPTGAQTTPTLTVTPAANLVDGDLVTVQGSGFTPLSTVFFCQGIQEGTPGPEDCGAPFSTVIPNSAGEFTSSYFVRRFMTPPVVGAEIDCAQPGAGCLIGALDATAALALAPLGFAPQPPRTLSVSPSSNLLDGSVVSVQGSGFTPSTTVNFCQGVAEGTPGFEDCGAASESAVVTAAGQFSANYTVVRFITTAAGSRDCAASSGNCVMNFITGGAAGIGRVPLAFAPQTPVPPIFGTVTDPDGDPVAGAPVWVYAPGDAWVGSLQTTTNAQGSYAFPTVDLGMQYRIRFGRPTGTALVPEWFNNSPTRQAADVIVLSSSADFVRADAQLAQASAISGVVTDANGPLAGVQVSAFGPTDTTAATYVTSTAANGTYLLGNVGAADYKIRFVPPQGSGLKFEWFDNAPLKSQATLVPVVSGQATTGINAVLAPIP